MPSLTIRCAEMDKDRLRELMDGPEDEDQRIWYDAWSNIHGGFHFSDNEEEFDSQYDSLQEFCEIYSPPPLFAFAKFVGNPWAMIWMGGRLDIFDVDNQQDPVVIVREGEYLYDIFAGTQLYWELRKEFEIYMKMRGCEYGRQMLHGVHVRK